MHSSFPSDLKKGSPEINSKQDQEKKKKSYTENNTSVNDTQWQQQQQMKKWVQNLTNTPLTDVQEKVLDHGSNFAVVANDPPIANT